jgi:hypothetical protein
LAAERDEPAAAVVAAVQAQEAVGRDASCHDGVKRVLEELLGVDVDSVFGLSEESRGVMMNTVLQRTLLRAPGGGLQGKPPKR